MNSVVLLSGGLDSAVNLAYAQTEGDVRLALTINYGQRAARREIEAAGKLAQFYKIPFQVIELPWLAEITKTALVNQDSQLPEPAAQDLDRSDLATKTAAAVWVPNRNGLFVNIAACFAENLNCELVITGFNREEAAAFADNTPEFSLAATAAMLYSTANKVKVLSYTGRLDKMEIVALGSRLGLPWELIWSCYHGSAQMCGKCESCLRLMRALRKQNIDLPLSLFETNGGGK